MYRLTRIHHLCIIILLSCAACQQTFVTPAHPPTDIPTAAALSTSQPTRTPRRIAAPTPTHTPPPPPTSAPVQFRPTLPPVTPTTAPARPSNVVIIGRSVQGQPIVAHRFGEGEAVLLLVGGIHGSWESNTVALMDALMAHFETDPNAVLPGITVMVVPVLNPDGLTLASDEERILDGRFNANGVDLNRNWGCGWSAEAFWRNETVSAGNRPFSEPESAAMQAFILTVRPAAVLFYHSAAGGVFAGDCRPGNDDSLRLAGVVGEAAGYTYGEPFTAYPVTGTAPSWVDEQGIPSADVELQSWQNSEFERNLRGVIAVQCWLTNTAC